MNNQPNKLANRLADGNDGNDGNSGNSGNSGDNGDNNDQDEVMGADPLEEETNNKTENEDEEETPNQEPNKNIKSVELTGKDATFGLKAPNGANNTNLTKKNKNNPNRNSNLTQKQKQNANANPSANPSANASTGDNNVMRSLNKVAMNLLNHQIVMKLFHFQTELYGAHKASDAYIEKFATTMDKFLEIAQGIYGRLTIKKFKLEGSSHTDENIMKHIEGIITLLRTGIDDVLDTYTDLINIRDELVGDVEQLKYLLSFK
jgi:Family of unknown function (DUF5856)